MVPSFCCDSVTGKDPPDLPGNRMLVAGRDRLLCSILYILSPSTPFPFHWHQVPVVTPDRSSCLPPNITLHDIVSFFSAQCAPSCLIIRVAAAGVLLRVNRVRLPLRCAGSAGPGPRFSCLLSSRRPARHLQPVRLHPLIHTLDQHQAWGHSFTTTTACLPARLYNP